MSGKFLQTFLSIFIMMWASESLAYKQDTHQVFSERAVERSILEEDALFLKRFGIASNINSENLFPSSEGELLSVKDLVREGSYLEDEGNRAFNHFYDPQNEKPLTIFGIELGDISPIWSLTKNADSSFSMEDAYESFITALETSPTSIDGNEYWGRTFQSLGHMIHHIQDMTQPQHTRNDDHCDILPCLLVDKYNLSAYEVKSSRENFSLPLEGYPDVHLETARDYWNDEPKTSGIAVFSSNNFVSEGTNFRVSEGQVISHPDLPLPSFQDTFLNEVDLNQVRPNSQLNGVVRYYGNTYSDNYTGEIVRNEFMTLESIFSTNLTGVALAFGLDSNSYRSMQNILVPRAVGYSAGFIDHFFRIQLELVGYQDDGRVGTVTFRNISQTGDIRFGLKAGTVQGLGDSRVYLVGGGISRLDDRADQLLTEDIPYGESFSISFLTSELHNDLPFSLIFKGATYVEGQPEIVEMGVGGFHLPRKPAFFTITERLHANGRGIRSTDPDTDVYTVFNFLDGFVETKSESSRPEFLGENYLSNGQVFHGESTFVRRPILDSNGNEIFHTTKDWSNLPAGYYNDGAPNVVRNSEDQNLTYISDLWYDTATGNYECFGIYPTCQTNEDWPPIPEPLNRVDLMQFFNFEGPFDNEVISKEKLSTLGIEIPESYGGLRITGSEVKLSRTIPSGKIITEPSQIIHLSPANESAAYIDTLVQ